MSNHICIIDGNNLYSRAFHIVKSQKESPLFFCLKMFFNLKANFKDAKFIFTFDTCKSKRRLDIYPEYKANRKRNMTDEEYQVYVSNFQAFVKAIRLSGYTVLDGEGYEADDYISILTYMLKRNYRVSIVTTDKDMFQLIDENVRVYEPIKQISITMDNFKQFVKIPLKHFLTYKCLRGDDSDNIKGIHGIGEITATELIETYGSFENMVLEISKKEKVSSKEKKILEGKEIFKRNVALMDLRLCFVDDNLKMLVRQKVNDFKASREELFELLGEFQLETLTDKVINPKCLTKQ